MQLFKERQPPMPDLEKLEQEIRGEAPPWSNSAPRERISAPPRDLEERPAVPLQIIAHAITRLTWTDAVAMGDAIDALVKEGKPQTAAIQEWAAKWETFGE